MTEGAERNALALLENQFHSRVHMHAKTKIHSTNDTKDDLVSHRETVALAPAHSGGRDVDVVRLALHEPSAIARTNFDFNRLVTEITDLD